MQPDSSTNLRPIKIPPHARQRLNEREADLDVVYAYLNVAREIGPRSGCRAIPECNPVLLVEFRQGSIVLTSALEPGMALKPDTQILHVNLCDLHRARQRRNMH